MTVTAIPARSAGGSIKTTSASSCLSGIGAWPLAMAAYNSGEPRVMGAIVKNGRADFWDLCDKQLLPKETRDYVPKILAAIKIVSRAEEYGLTASSATANSGS